MATHKDNFYERVSQKNQVTEMACEEHFKSKGYLHRFGWDKMPSQVYYMFTNLPQSLKSMPDYIFHSKKGISFIESKGYANHFKFKKRDYEAYKIWNNFEVPFYIFAYDCPKKKETIINLNKIIQGVEAGLYEEGAYENDGNEYYIIRS